MNVPLVRSVAPCELTTPAAITPSPYRDGISEQASAAISIWQSAACAARGKTHVRLEELNGKEHERLCQSSPSIAYRGVVYM